MRFCLGLYIQYSIIHSGQYFFFFFPQLMNCSISYIYSEWVNESRSYSLSVFFFRVNMSKQWFLVSLDLDVSVLQSVVIVFLYMCPCQWEGWVIIQSLCLICHKWSAGQKYYFFNNWSVHSAESASISRRISQMKCHPRIKRDWKSLSFSVQNKKIFV